MRPFLKAFAWTAIPTTGFGVLSTLGNKGGEGLGFLLGFVWFIGAMAAVGALFILLNFYLNFYLVHRPDERGGKALGILVGFAIGISVLAATCVSNLHEVGPK